MKLKITQLAGADIQIIGSVNAHCKLSGVSEIKISPDLLSEIVQASVRDKYYGDSGEGYRAISAKKGSRARWPGNQTHLVEPESTT